MNRPCDRRRRLMLAAGLAGLLPACKEKPAPSTARPGPLPEPPPDWLLTPGAPPPDWSLLDPWQERVTRADFERLLTGVLSDGASWFGWVELTDTAAFIRTASPRLDAPRYELKFARPEAAPSAGPRYWRRLEELPPLRDPARPLEDVHVAVDAGHIGGVWSKIEERHMQPGNTPPVKEGDITLRTARILAPMLEALGARVTLVRKQPEPATPLRPSQLMEAARASLEQDGRSTEGDAVRKEAERLFYRAHEIRARAARINGEIKPDLVLHLHFNADGPSSQLTSANHLHILAHGSLNAGEFRLDDQRLDGLLRLVQGIPDVEIPLCTVVAKRMAEATGLPPFTYLAGPRMVPDQPYVWIRNLLANRVYRCPVVFPEPYVMNNPEVIERIHAGDYEDKAMVAGAERVSIFREYAGGVTAGLRDYFAARSA
jgi:N-acetylmuramoyl-L-alanine amidase